jgi:hypothetical protein
VQQEEEREWAVESKARLRVLSTSAQHFLSQSRTRTPLTAPLTASGGTPLPFLSPARRTRRSPFVAKRARAAACMAALDFSGGAAPAGAASGPVAPGAAAAAGGAAAVAAAAAARQFLWGTTVTGDIVPVSAASCAALPSGDVSATTSGGATVVLPARPTTPASQRDVLCAAVAHDAADMQDTCAASVLHCVRSRYERGLRFTNVGSVLVAVRGGAAPTVADDAAVVADDVVQAYCRQSPPVINEFWAAGGDLRVPPTCPPAVPSASIPRDPGLVRASNSHVYRLAQSVLSRAQSGRGEHCSIVAVGGAGSGKSSLCRAVVRCLARSGLSAVGVGSPLDDGLDDDREAPQHPANDAAPAQLADGSAEPAGDSIAFQTPHALVVRSRGDGDGDGDVDDDGSVEVMPGHVISAAMDILDVFASAHSLISMCNSSRYASLTAPTHLTLCRAVNCAVPCVAVCVRAGIRASCVCGTSNDQRRPRRRHRRGYSAAVASSRSPPTTWR